MQRGGSVAIGGGERIYFLLRFHTSRYIAYRVAMMMIVNIKSQ